MPSEPKQPAGASADDWTEALAWADREGYCNRGRNHANRRGLAAAEAYALGRASLQCRCEALEAALRELADMGVCPHDDGEGCPDWCPYGEAVDKADALLRDTEGGSENGD